MMKAYLVRVTPHLYSREYAESKWHAIEKAYTKHRNIEKNRSNYTVVKNYKQKTPQLFI